MAKSRTDTIREAAENDLISFIRLVHPNRLLGSIHIELIEWMTREDGKSHQLILLPRDHGKSAIVGGYYTAWMITRNPAIRILYLSATSQLAVKQVKFIKDILTSPIYRRYWPEMVHPDEGKREKWTETEFSVDHPLRRAENIRDATVFSGGLTTTITGLHCDLSIFDDVVVRENAYTEEGRSKVRELYSLLASVEGGVAKQKVVGTRYHPKDLYNDVSRIEVQEFDEEGELTVHEKLYEVFERIVEDSPGRTGTGAYLWPVEAREDGKLFGFNQKILARKRAQYLDKTQFYAQYYNDPNDVSGSAISREYFQYYEKGFLKRLDGKWYFKDQRLNLFASIDFAYSLTEKSDYTAIVVIGVDGRQNYYVLDIERFKTDKISEYYKNILRMHMKWDFHKLVAEVTAAQAPIVKDLKDNYIRKNGLSLAVADFKPNRSMGSKEERIKAVLQARYANRQMWHFQGGYCETLEDELVLSNPPHDDVKDALASVVDAAIPPSGARTVALAKHKQILNNIHPKFGGVL